MEQMRCNVQQLALQPSRHIKINPLLIASSRSTPNNMQHPCPDRSDCADLPPWFSVPSQERDWAHFSELVTGLTENLASVFNHLIYSLNAFRKKVEVMPQQVKGEQEPQVIDLERAESEGSQTEQLRRSRLRGQQEQDENKPKKPVSSFFLFYKSKLKEWENSNSKDPNIKISKLVAAAWAKLTKQEKRPFEEKAKETRDKYKEEMRKYIESHNEEIENYKLKKRHLHRIKKGEIDIGEDVDEDDIRTKLKGVSLKLMRDEHRKDYAHRPKAPVSSFFIFYRTESKNLAEKYKECEGKKLARIASEVWKGMNEEERIPYKIGAQEQRERYHEEMREYREKFPEEVESRKRRISGSMRRNYLGGFRKNRNRRRDDESSDDNIPDILEDSSDSMPTLKDEDDPPHRPRTPENKPRRPRKPKEPKEPREPREPKEGEEGEGEGEKERRKKNRRRKQLTEAQKERRRESRRDSKFPHKPRGVVGSFFQFYQRNMNDFSGIQENGQKLQGSQLVKKASARWKALPPAELQFYHQLAREDNARYQIELRDYQQNYPEEYERYMQSISRKRGRPDEFTLGSKMPIIKDEPDSNNRSFEDIELDNDLFF